MVETLKVEVRPAQEIQDAHDRLLAIINGEVPNPFGGSDRTRHFLKECASVLCWVLMHEHNELFGTNLKRLDDWLLEHGYYVLTDCGRLEASPAKRLAATANARIEPD